MVDFKITENEAGQRLDRFLRKYMKRAPLSMIYKTIRKDVKVNGKRAHEDTILQEGDQLSLYLSLIHICILQMLTSSFPCWTNS